VGRMARCLAAACLLGLSFAAGPAGSSGAGPVSSARVLAVQVIVPGQSGASAGSVSAPPDGVALGGGFAYPDDGSAVSIGSLSGKATALGSGSGSSAAATVTAGSVSLFGGEITADAVTGAAHALARAGGGSGDFSGAGVSNLVALGQPVGSAPGSIALADWGTLSVLSGSVSPGSAAGAPSYQESTTALVVQVNAAHGSLPAGSEILIGYAEAAAQGTNPAPPAPPPVTTAPPTTTASPPSPPAPPPPPAVTTAPTETTPAPAASRPRAPSARKPAAPKQARPLKPPEPAEASA